MTPSSRSAHQTTFIAATALLVPAVAALAGPNLMQNPGFEQGSGAYPGVGLHWETNDAAPWPDHDALDGSIKFSGAWSQRVGNLSDPVWDRGFVRQVSPYNSVTPGKTYQTSAWIRKQGGGNPAGWYVFGVWVFNNQDIVIAEQKMPNTFPITYDWTFVSFQGVAPPGASRVAALLTAHTDSLVWYDDVFIGELTTGDPEIGLAPAGFSRRIVGVPGSLPDDQFSVQNTGGGTLDYAITDDAGWLSVAPATGDSTGEPDPITIQYSVAGLGIGTHPATITITDAAATNSPQTIAVELEVRVPGDVDGDGDVDMEDFGGFQACLSGPGVPVAAGCELARLDEDVDADADDFGAFQACLTGASVTGDLACAGE